MKCPNCNFVTSNSNDLCTRCGMDLRPRKRELGIAVTNPLADIKELRAKLATHAKAAAEQAAIEKASQDKKIAETSDAKSDRPKNERSWLSRLFGRAAATGPITAENKEAASAAPSRSLSPFASTKSPSDAPSADPTQDQTASADPSPQPAAPGFEFPNTAASSAGSTNESVVGTSSSDPVELGDKLGEDIQPDLSLNDFLSELERFQTSADSNSNSDQLGSSDPFEVDTPAPAAADFAEAEELDGFELPDFGLDDSHDLLAGLGIPTTPQAATGEPGLSAAADEDDRPLFDTPPSNPLSASTSGGLSTVEAHEMALDDLIGSMASHAVPAESDDPEEDELFSALIRNVPAPAEQLDDLALSMEEHIEDAMAATSELADKALFAAELDQFDDTDENSEEQLEDDDDELSNYRGKQDISEDAGLHDDDEYSMTSAEEADDFEPHEDFESFDSVENSEDEGSMPPVQQSSAPPGATPDVMEFDDDDQILEQQLDEMLGDLVLDVKAVKSAKPTTPKRDRDDDSDESIFIDDDLEISFEIEDEDGDYEEDEEDSEELADSQAADPTGSDQILNQLVAAFNQIDSDTEHRSIAEAPADPQPVRQQVDLEKMLQRLRAAAQTGSPNLIDELLNQVASGFGIDSHLLREAVNPAGATTNEVELSEAVADDNKPEKTDPAEPVEPILTGRTFVATPEPVRQLEAGDDLESLGGELDRELAALMSEGTSIFGEGNGPTEAPTTLHELATKAEPLEDQGIAAPPLEAYSAVNQSADLESTSDELGDLSSELDRELALLQAEGTTILGHQASEQILAGVTEETDAYNRLAAQTSSDPDLSDLESELDSEIAALEADGLTFHTESSTEEEVGPSDAPVQAAVEVGPGPIDEDLASLEQALDSELAALVSEGTNFAISDNDGPALQVESNPVLGAELENDENLSSQPEVTLTESSSEVLDQPSKMSGSPTVLTADSENEFAPTMTGAFLVSDLTALEQTLDQELAALSAEGMTFAGGEVPTGLEVASTATTDEQESAAVVAIQDLTTEAEPLAVQAEDQAADVEFNSGEFTPTMTGAFLASDFAALLSTSAEKVITDDDSAKDKSETAQLDSSVEEQQTSFGQSDDIRDLEAELDQELALLQAEGFGISKESEPSEELQAQTDQTCREDAEQLSADSESEIELGELEAIEPDTIDEEVDLGSLEDLAQEEEQKSIDFAQPTAIFSEANVSAAPSTPPSIHSEAENSATATGVFLAADLEAILNSYKVPPRLSDEPLPEEVAPSHERASIGSPALPEAVIDSIEPVGLESVEDSLKTQEHHLESAIVEEATIEACDSDPTDQTPVTNDEVIDVEIEEFEEEETNVGAPARVPFNPEEVSIEAEDEPAMNFSAEAQEMPRHEFSQEVVGEIQVDASEQPSSEQADNLNDPPAALEPEPRQNGLSSDNAETNIDDEIDEDDDDFPSTGRGEIPAVLWMRALEDPDLDSLEMEIEAVELCEVGPSPKVTMLFDLAEEELAAPVQLKAYVEAIPTSVNRELVDAGLKRAVKRYEKEVHQELTRPRDSASSSDTFDINVSIEALFSVHSPAALWRRAAALTFDLTVSIMLASTAVWFLLLDSSVKDLISDGSIPQLVEILPGLIAVAGISWLIWAIFNVLPTSESGQTGGQRMFGIAVFDLEGNTPGFGQIFVRTMLEITTVLTGGLGILPGFGKHRRMLHDRLACTVVVQING